MPDRQSEQGSWVARNRQSLASGRWSAGISKKRLMACISPCQRGLSISLLVSATTTERSDFRRIAAPKSLLPRATPAAVTGAMCFSMTSKRREISAALSKPLFLRANETDQRHTGGIEQAQAVAIQFKGCHSGERGEIGAFLGHD